MSRILSDQPKIAIGVAIGVGVVTAGVTVGYWLKQKFEDRPPKKWTRIGEISDLVLYPLKSGGPVRLDSFNCTQMGLETEGVRDRTFMIIKSSGLLVTGRMHPKLVKISPEIGRDSVTFTAPDTQAITINFKELQGRDATQKVEIWNHPVQTVDCGDTAARWVSRYLLDEDEGMRLVFYPFNESTRDLRVKLTIAAGMKQSDSGALHDETSLMLINAASVDDLNTRLEHKVTPSQFRPNFVVKGAQAYVEDTWKWVRIGNVVTKNLRPCASWVRVGEISDLVCYPIKSCGPIRLNAFKCTPLGLEEGNLRDRTFMIISSEGQFITGRTYPKVVQIMPKIENDTMTLSAPGMMDVAVDFKRLHSSNTNQTSVWSQPVQTLDCGEEVARWLSRYLVSEDFGMRLVYFPSTVPTRDVREKNKIFDTMSPKDSGALHDATSLMMLNLASVTDLNTRLEKDVTPSHFRPNFVVKGATAYAEDTWKWVRFGQNVIAKNIKPCSRCVFTNVDPETGTRSDDGQPLKALREYRKIPECGEAPILGIHLGTRAEGTVAIGDPVYVGVS